MTLNSDALQVPGMITRRCCNSGIIIYANNWKKTVDWNHVQNAVKLDTF